MTLAAAPSARVLRGHPALPPFPFEELVEREPEAPAPPPFVPLAPLAAASTPARPPAPPPQRDPTEAYAEGRAAGRAERDDEVEALQAQVARLTDALAEAHTAAEQQAADAARTADRLSTTWAEAMRQAEPGLCSLALEAAEAVLDAPLSPEQRAALDHALAEAVDALAADGPIAVTLHPVDLLHLQENGLAASLSGAHPALRWEPDEALAQGDWAVSTSEAAVRRIQTAMLASLRARLGLATL